MSWPLKGKVKIIESKFFHRIDLKAETIFTKSMSGFSRNSSGIDYQWVALVFYESL